MEYLMTYGWAILIIAVVLGALFSIGVFNPSYFEPRAQPGICQVYRPFGPKISEDAILSGVCTGEIPEFVAALNGRDAFIVLPPGKTMLSANPGAFTMTAWIKIRGYPNGDGAYPPGMSEIFDVFKTTGNEYPDGTNTFAIGLSNNSLDYPGANYMFWASSGSNVNRYVTPALALNRWYFVALSSDALRSAAYVNQTNVATFAGMQNAGLDTQRSYIGSYFWNQRLFNGSIANVQLYNYSLDSAQITALYQEGIGGPPIDVQYLVGWWPLNGNYTDYSGDYYNATYLSATGNPYSNDVFTSRWLNGYSVP